MEENYNKKNFIIDKCDNCGNMGHDYKQCMVPITSWGIILVKINNQNNENLGAKRTSNGIYIENNDSLKKISEKMNLIKFLLVRRKYSLGYTEFIRGNYKKDNIDGIIFLFQQMTPNEITKIQNSSFDELWDDFWTVENKKKSHVKKKYYESKENFECLKNKKNVELSLNFYIKNVKPIYKLPEWGYPKGRKMKGESDLNCAVREFCEETGYCESDIKIMSNVKPIIENIIGTNGISYRHVYYLAEDISNKELKIDINIDNNISSNEIGDIGFFTYEECMLILREYHVEKKNITKNIYLYLLESLINNSNQECEDNDKKEWMVKNDIF